ncbi:hypothetical protein ACFQ3S_05000 [Mucilaginibacter terrae]|uniref:hypothetical protein n=1 Tax=Mucilaginibacter terrae TaxID=1955052 RepID=UPI00363DDEF5
MVKMMAGDYADGLMNMWVQALTDPVYLTNLAVAFVIGAAPAETVTFIEYENITYTTKSIPNFQIGMTLNEFEVSLATKTSKTWQPAPSDPSIKNLYIGNFRYSSRTVSTSNLKTVDVYYKGKLQVKYRLQ